MSVRAGTRVVTSVARDGPYSFADSLRRTVGRRQCRKIREELPSMSKPRRVYRSALSLLCVSLLPLAASAQTQGVEERLSKIESAAASAQVSGDNAWMLVCAALVLMMTGPGLALFYGGLVRRKNVLATMMQSFILMAVVTVLWAAFGYSIAFAEGTPFSGSLAYAFLRGVGTAPNETYAATIP